LKLVQQIGFAIAPAVLTVVLAAIGTRAAIAIKPTVLAAMVLLAFVSLIVWHAALIHRHRNGVGYLVYAVFNILLCSRVVLPWFVCG
jgi:hypothetical protein